MLIAMLAPETGAPSESDAVTMSWARHRESSANPAPSRSATCIVAGFGLTDSSGVAVGYGLGCGVAYSASNGTQETRAAVASLQAMLSLQAWPPPQA